MTVVNSEAESPAVPKPAKDRNRRLIIVLIITQVVLILTMCITALIFEQAYFRSAWLDGYIWTDSAEDRAALYDAFNKVDKNAATRDEAILNRLETLESLK